LPRGHLGPDENIHLVFLHALAHLLEGQTLARTVAVDPQHPRAWEQLSYGVLDALGAMTGGREVLIAAARAGAQHRFFVPAVMAAQSRLPQMEHQARRTTCARRAPAAREAHHRR
jgi:hypothetical protein